MANRHYLSPFCRAIRSKNYPLANDVLDEYIQNRTLIQGEDYYAFYVECKDADIMWKVICHLEIESYGNERNNYYEICQKISTIRGSSRRIRHLFEKALTDEAPPCFKDYMLAFAYTYSNYKDRYAFIRQALQKGASTNVQIHQYEHQGRTMMEKIIKWEDQSMFRTILAHHPDTLFDMSNEVLCPISLLASHGLLEKWLGEELELLNDAQKDHYESYLLLDLMKRADIPLEERL